MTLEAFRKARAEEKRKDALAAARAVFSRDGFERAAMEAIAHAAGISTATLYRYFPSKEALFEAAALDAIEAMEVPVAAKADPVARMRALALSYAELLAEPGTRAFMRMLIAETGRNPHLAELFYEAIKTRIGESFASAYAVGRAAGALRATKDVGHAVGQLQGMIEHAVLMRGLVLGDEIPTLRPVKDIARDAIDTWLARWRA
jgi:AcrR family transcriptional regulator